MCDVTLVIPVYNEADNISVAILAIESKVTVPYQIKIIYDFEQDNTRPVIARMQEDRSNVALVKNKYGRGVLNAIKTGLEEAEGKYAIVTMADLSDPPEVINDMYSLAERGNADIVCASRYMKGGRQIGGPRLKGFLSRMAGLTLRWFAGLPTHDATNSFKLYRTSFLREQTIESRGGFEIGLELVAKAYVQGRKILECPTIWRDRTAGESRFRLLQWLPRYIKWWLYAFRRKKG